MKLGADVTDSEDPETQGHMQDWHPRRVKWASRKTSIMPAKTQEELQPQAVFGWEFLGQGVSFVPRHPDTKGKGKAHHHTAINNPTQLLRASQKSQWGQGFWGPLRDIPGKQPSSTISHLLDLLFSPVPSDSLLTYTKVLSLANETRFLGPLFPLGQALFGGIFCKKVRNSPTISSKEENL